MTPRRDDMRHFLNANNEVAQIAETVKSAVRARCHIGPQQCVCLVFGY
jgi:hypothetical protein